MISFLWAGRLGLGNAAGPLSCIAHPRSFVRCLSDSTKNDRSDDVVLHHQDNGVAVLTLNSPPMNPLTSSLGRSFKAACETLSRDNSVRTVVLTGAGDRAFSAGGDFDFLRERANTTPARNVQVMRDFYDLYLTSIRQIGVPTLAAINGHAVGAGLCLALACDMRIAHPNAKLGLNFVKLGLTPGMAGSHLLPYLLSHQNAAYLLLTGRLIPASEAKDMGLVLRTADDPLESALRIAKEIAENSPVAVRAVTKTLRMRWEDGIERGLAREADTQAIAYASEDFKEGLDAVANKRTATFKDF